MLRRTLFCKLGLKQLKFLMMGTFRDLNMGCRRYRLGSLVVQLSASKRLCKSAGESSCISWNNLDDDVMSSLGSLAKEQMASVIVL